MSQAINLHSETTYQGVGGWLLLFCLSLTLFNPLLGIYNLVSGYSAASAFFAQIPALQTYMLVEFLVAAGVIAYSVYAGGSLWLVKPNAIHTVKHFFVVILCYAAIEIFLPFLVGLPPNLSGPIAAASAGAFVKGIIYVTIWSLYLNRSRRVKATFPKS
jgi:Protein of unknown function (DUF2569)